MHKKNAETQIHAHTHILEKRLLEGTTKSDLRLFVCFYSQDHANHHVEALDGFHLRMFVFYVCMHMYMYVYHHH